MSKPLRITIGAGIALIVIIAGVVLFLRHLVIKSFPVTDGVLKAHGLQHAVQIFRDELGVPHIRANNEHDMFFAVGYVHAQDRLWQMDVTRRIGEGRLAEIFGTAAFEYDKLFRTIGIAKFSTEMQEGVRMESRLALEAYADGINAFVEEHQSRLPVEFDMLKYRPERWEPQHSLIVARMMAWDLNLAAVTDLTFGLIAGRVGPDKVLEILPGWDEDDRTQKVTPRTFSIDLDALDILKRAVYPTHFLETLARMRGQSGGRDVSGGSNCWVVGAKKSATGRPILANDIHLPMPAPSRWYQIHFSFEDSSATQWDVAGLSVPGTPFVIAGRNTSAAWGVTNLMADDADFFVERLDSSMTTYDFRGSTLSIDSREEKIYIGASDSVTITVRRTHHGPIVDEIMFSDSIAQMGKRYAIAMRWMGLEPSDESFAFYRMNSSKNAAEFSEGVSHIGVPGLNVLYADTAGNIGSWVGARIPMRGKGHPMFPLAGWSGENEWRGFVSTNELPHAWNPPDGYIASANNKPTGENSSLYISDLWEPPSRIQRIRQLLSSLEVLAPEDCRIFQMDVLSPFGKRFAARLLEALQSVSIQDTRLEMAAEYIRSWDYRFTKEDIASSIINVTFVKLLENTFEDELGDTALSYFSLFSAMPYRTIDQLLDGENVPWFDDVRTPQVETRNEILRKSLVEALHELRRKFGDDPKSWQWGNLHTVTFEHPFGKRKPLDNVFNIGPFSVGGSATTMNKEDFRLRNPYAAKVGPSSRQVIDLSNASTFSSVLTSGESGQALHKHYDDQTVLWLNGSYHQLTMDWQKILNSNWDHLELLPNEHTSP